MTEEKGQEGVQWEFPSQLLIDWLQEQKLKEGGQVVVS